MEVVQRDKFGDRFVRYIKFCAKNNANCTNDCIDNMYDVLSFDHQMDIFDIISHYNLYNNDTYIQQIYCDNMYNVDFTSFDNKWRVERYTVMMPNKRAGLGRKSVIINGFGLLTTEYVPPVAQ